LQLESLDLGFAQRLAKSKLLKTVLRALARMATLTAMTSSEIEQLFDRTLLGHYEDEGAWDAVSALQRDGDLEIFDIAARWLKAKEPLKRARAASILAQLRKLAGEADTVLQPKWLFREEAFALVVEMLASEEEPMVLGDGIMALGHLYNEAGIPVIVRYKDHLVQDVRFSVACALGCFPNDPLAVSTLIQLTGDEDSDVRDWSVFGLGVQGDVDSPEIRDALLRCLSDPDEDVREEAAVGLGKRHDIRLLPKLTTMLDMPVLKERVAEAASALLGLPEDPPEWGAEDYRRALKERFGPADRPRMTSNA
jgi:HEAT repeat protein